jgi:predicted DNA-binding transcriptional regulator AlpA
VSADTPRDTRELLEGLAPLEGMSAEEAADLLAKASRLQANLAAYLASERVRQPALAPSGVGPSRLLTPRQAAERLGVSPRWIYRHAASLPFTRRLSSRVLRFHEGELEKYLRQRRP